MLQKPIAIRYIGVEDPSLDLFEAQYPLKHGMSYNSYLLSGEKIAVLDTADARFVPAWLAGLENGLQGRTPDYLVVQHMEPDHSSGIRTFMERYPSARVVAGAKAFSMMRQFFGEEYADRRIQVSTGDTLDLGGDTLTFLSAPMVHWPEVIMSYLTGARILFSADAFGKFGVPETREDWDDEARRYYFGIVGKYGAQVQNVLKNLPADIAAICPLHGPALEGDLSHYLDLYSVWSSYRPESEGVTVAYTSVYGHTQKAVEALAESLRRAGETVAVYDLCRDDASAALADAFRYDRLVLATTTYNMEIFPPMRTFLGTLAEHGYRDRTVGLIENGSWAPAAARKMTESLNQMKDIRILEPAVTIRSALSGDSQAQLEALSRALRTSKK